MRVRPLLAAAALCLAATAAPASAGAETVWRGGCSYDAVLVPGASGYSGYLSANYQFASPVPADNPVSAVVTCTLRHWGEPVATLTASGTGVVVHAVPMTLPADFDYGFSDMCYTVDVTSDDTPTRSGCLIADYLSLAQPAVPVVEAVLAQVPGSREAVCETLASAGPFGHTHYVVREDGTVDAAGVVHWNCTE